MFKRFLDFVKEGYCDLENSEDFFKAMGGKSFLNGMYRIFSEKSFYLNILIYLYLLQ